MAEQSVTRPPRSLLGLRGRLALFFVAIVVVPLLVAFILLSGRLEAARRMQAEQSVTRSAEAVGSMLATRRFALGAIAELVGQSTGQSLRDGDIEAVDVELEETFEDSAQAVDFIVAVDRGGQVVAEAGREPVVAAGSSFSTPQEIAGAVEEGAGIPGAIVAGRRLVVGEESVGFVAAGQWLDSSTLSELPSAGAMGGIATLAGDEIWAWDRSAVPLDPTTISQRDGHFVAESPDGQALVGRRVDGVDVGGARVVVWINPSAPSQGIGRTAAAVLLPAALGAAIAGWLLAGTVVDPIEQASRAANAMAARRFEVRVPVGGGGRELDELAVALNAMSDQLQGHLAELERSRDELRGSLSRLGETLSSSLDLDRTLAVVTETAMDTLAADRAVLVLYTPERDALYAKVGRGVGEGVPRLRPGEGRLGWVAEQGVAAMSGGEVHDGEGARTTLPPPAPEEPASDRQLLVPLVGRGETLGVLSLYRDSLTVGDYSLQDLETLQSFAAQAAVAVENVLLHEEAQRRSITDPLTGLWNFRHFEAQAARELESAVRFDRPLSLLVLDLDHFKEINDRLGHQAGDEVLRELARRIRESARAPDLVARYGGEEFVVLLPGADADGARISAERMRERLRATPYEVGEGVAPVSVTCSIGIACYPDHAVDVSGLLRRADAALYAAKDAGRDRVEISSDAVRDQRSA